jgi:antitoxin ParD1/3/4
MTIKLSISLTNEQAKVVEDAVASGAYASASEVVRDALRRWRADQILGRLWDEGVASGIAEHQMTAEEIKAEGRRRRRSAA